METFAWSKLNPNEIKKLEADIVTTYKTNINKIKKLKSESRTFANTVLAINRLAYNADTKTDYSDMMNAVHLLASVSTDEKVRVAAQNLEQSINTKIINLTLDKQLYQAYVEYRDHNYQIERCGSEDKTVKALSKEQIYLSENTELSLSRMGFALSDKKFAILKSKLETLATLSQEFRVNINNWQDHILCTIDELDGCSARYIQSLPTETHNGETMYKVDLSYPSSGPYMSYAHNRKKRKELADKLSMKGGKDNLKILQKMIKLRQDISDILGYKNYVDYKVEDRMAKNLKSITTLINSVRANIKDKAKSDYKSLSAIAKELKVADPTYYDMAYLTEKLSEQTFDINKESLREYFETDRVIDYMFKLFGELFAFQVTELDKSDMKKLGFSPWDKHVKVFKVINNKRRYKLNNYEPVGEDTSEELLSYLILDLYPRQGKFGHAAAFNINHFGAKSVALVCNFPEPSAHMPSLLSIDEVETLYHEFGHATHFMLADTELCEHNGFNVSWDFVETPSQMLEEWVYDYDELRALAVHYKDNTELDPKVIDNILDSKKFMSGRFWMRQLVLSQLDIDLHLGKNVVDDVVLPPHKYYEYLTKKYLQIDISSKNLFPASFGHLDGYDAGYYSYLWAKVYAVDFYSKFFKARNLDKKGDENRMREGSHASEQEIGLRYRREILGIGSSRDEQVSAKAFLGRVMNDKAFVKSL